MMVEVDLDKLLASLAIARHVCTMSKRETNLRSMSIGIDIVIKKLDLLADSLTDLTYHPNQEDTGAATSTS